MMFFFRLAHTCKSRQTTVRRRLLLPRRTSCLSAYDVRKEALMEKGITSSAGDADNDDGDVPTHKRLSISVGSAVAADCQMHNVFLIRPTMCVRALSTAPRQTGRTAVDQRPKGKAVETA